MGFGDKLKGLRDQAQNAVAENKDKIQGAVQGVGEAANVKTKGKYADKIAKVGDKFSASVEKMAGDEGSEAPEAAAATESATATATEPAPSFSESAAPSFSEPEAPSFSEPVAPGFSGSEDTVTPPAATEAPTGAPEFE
jgi:uncharacterized membrane protein